MEYFEYRSRSCPDLTIYSPHSPLPHRKRAFSEHYCEATDADGGILGMRAMSQHSESDLRPIDEPFDVPGQLDKTGNLLVDVVKALATFDEETQSEGGVHLFSDSQIKLDETSSLSNAATDNNSMVDGPRKLRVRAASEHGWNRVLSNVQKQDETDSRDWTWSGNHPQIHEFMKIRAKQKEREKNLNGGNAAAIMRNGLDTEMGQPDQGRRPSILQRINNLFRRRSTLPHEQHDVRKVPPPEPLAMKPKSPIMSHRPSLVTFSEKPSPLDRRKSFARNPRPPLLKQASTFSILSSVSDQDQEMLEGTTIADLIRAIEVLRMRESGMDPSQATQRLPASGDTLPPMLRKAALAFAAAPHRKPIASKSSVTSPARVSPLPTVDTSDESSRRSSVTLDRLRYLRQRSITEPSKPDSPVAIRGDAFAVPKGNPFGVQKPDPLHTAKNKFLQDKRAQFTRRFSAFPASGHVNDATTTRWRQIKKNLSDVEGRLGAVPTNTAPRKSFGGDAYPLISQLIMSRTRDELTPNAARRFSSASSQFVPPNRSVHATPITLRRTSLLPVSPLAGIPSVSLMADDGNRGDIDSVTDPITSEEETKRISRWRLMKRLAANKSDNKNSEPGTNS